MSSPPRPPLLGLCPIGKFVFSHADALQYKAQLQEQLRAWDVDFVDLEGVIEDGLVRDQAHVDPVVAHFRARQVDALFMPHCNFGTEGAVGMIGRKLGVPVLLWGPRDEAPLPDGRRLRDTLCGLFASSGVLRKLDVPFMYLANERIEDDTFRQGVDTFLRAAHVANTFRDGVRIGLIGTRIDFFWTTIINEQELLQRFNAEVVPFDMADFIRAVRDRAERGRDAYTAEIAAMRDRMTIEGFETDGPLIHVLAARDQVLALVADHGLDGVALRGFTSLVDELGAYTTYAASGIAEVCPIGHEADIHGAISDLLLRRAARGATPAWLTEFTVRHPTDHNAALLWHSGAPPSLCHPDDRLRIGHHWILPSPLSGMVHFRLQDGPVTVARFEGDTDGTYKLAVGQGRSTDGPATLNNYVWTAVDDWPHWERTLMEGPFIHHLAMAYGHYGDALEQACRFVPGLEAVRLDRLTPPPPGA